MIRQPSSHAQLYGWWLRALANPATPRHDGIAECGFYKMQHVRNGPWVPVRVFVVRELDRNGELCGPEILMAEVEGKVRRPESIWLRLTPISREDYAALMDRPTSLPAMAATMVKIDLTQTPMRPR